MQFREGGRKNNIVIYLITITIHILNSEMPSFILKHPVD